MCVSLTSDAVVDFSDTLLYAAETIHPESQKTVHVLGYQNTVQNNVDKTLGSLGSLFKNISQIKLFNSSTDVGLGNAMILPFPAKPGTMSKLNVIDTENFPNFLTDIATAILHDPNTLSFSSSPSRSKQKVEIFEAAGIYTVILAQNIRDIPDVLKEIPIRKRPNPNPEIFEAYAEWYPDWTFALCCFNNSDKKKALPMLWWYEPMFSDILFLPALDSHDGSVPQLDAEVYVDHTIAVGSNIPSESKEMIYMDFNNIKSVNYSDGVKIPLSVKPFLVNSVIGKQFRENLKNGDFYFKVSDVRKRTFNPIRHFSPNAAGITENN